jgi:hypothetical protein
MREYWAINSPMAMQASIKTGINPAVVARALFGSLFSTS